MQLDPRINDTSTQGCIANIRAALEYYALQITQYTDLDRDQIFDTLQEVLCECDDMTLWELIPNPDYD